MSIEAAILEQHGRPSPGEFEAPQPSDEGIVVDVTVAGVNPIDLTVASGKMPALLPELPAVAGREGIGTIGEQRMYFDHPIPPYGSMAEQALIDGSSTIEVSDDVPDETAVGFGIAGLAGWLSLQWTAELGEDETVLVLGASGVVGQIAVQAARLLGAGRIVAAARDPEALEHAGDLGADATVRIDGTAGLDERFAEAADGEVDVIVDPLWGEPAVSALKTMARGGRLAQIGNSAGVEATVPAGAVRGAPGAIVGHTNFAVPQDVKRQAFQRMCGHAAAGELEIEVETMPLNSIEEAWRKQEESPHHKLVISP